jgi:hypothetical protein
MRDSNAGYILSALPLALFSLVMAGCYTQLKTDLIKYEPVPEPPHISVKDLSVTVDRPWYDRSPSDSYVTIGARFDNNSDVPVLLAGCPHPPAMVIEEWQGGEWQDGLHIGLFCQFPGKKTVKIKGRESLEFEIHLKYPGWYRVRLLVGPDMWHPLANVYSSQFLIR